MAKKPSVTTVSSGFASNTQLNANFTALRDAFDNTLSLDGSSPNAMGADLDLNNNDLLNASVVNTATLKIGGVNVVPSAATALAIKKEFNTVAALLADTETYSSYAENDYLRVVDGGFTYRVAASGASDQNLTTAGGVKLYVLTANGCVTPEQFGIVASASVDATAGLQAVLDYLSAQPNGGTLVLPPKTYYITSLRMPPYVIIRGEQAIPFAEGQTVGGSQFRQIAGTTGPLLYTDVDRDGTQVRSVAIASNEGNQYYYNSGIEDLVLNVRSSGNADTRCDALRIERVWGFGIRRSTLLCGKRGFALRAIDCNVMYMAECSCIGPTFFWSIADSYFDSNSFGFGTNGIASEIHFWPTLWLAQEFCWKNTFQGNIVFNNTNNIGGLTFTFTASGDTLTLGASHSFNDGDPVVLETTGTLPTGASTLDTYFVKVVSSTQVKLAAMKKNVAAGTFISLSGGSGTHTLRGGANTNLFLSKAQQNSFVGGRYDQGFGSGIILRGAVKNTFVGGTLQENGLGSGSTVTAIRLEDGALNNSFKGTILSGNATQTVGIAEYTTNTGNVLDVSSTDHSGGNIVSPNIGVQQFVYLNVGDFTAITGTPTVGLIGGTRRAGWLMDATTQEGIGTTFTVPEGWNTVRFVLHWVNAGAGSGNVAFLYNFGQFADGVTVNAADPISSNVIISTAGAQDVLMAETFAAAGAKPITPGRVAFLRMIRVAADAGDTLANDIALIGVRVERVT